MMKGYDYLLIGAGMASAAAVAGIRQLDASGSIGIAGAETEAPYARPPLSKGLWKDATIEGIRMDTGDAELLLGAAVASLDAPAHSVLLEDGRSLEYGKLLLATGGRPRRLARGGQVPFYLRSLGDYRSLRAAADPASRFLVLGGGFLGGEIAAALAASGKKVVLALRGAGPLERILPPFLSLFLGDYLREKGVELLAGESVAAIEPRGTGGLARMDSGQEVEADAIVACLGLEPNLELAEAAGLPLDEGIAAGPDLRAGDPAVFAAGDVASFYCGALGRRIRVEHEDNALAMGLAAGRSMAGAAEPYDRIPYFYSDIFDLGLEAVGAPDSRLEAFVDWELPFEKGAIYYLGEGRVRGVLLWNLRRRTERARALVSEGGPFLPGDLVGRLR